MIFLNISKVNKGFFQQNITFPNIPDQCKVKQYLTSTLSDFKEIDVNVLVRFVASIGTYLLTKLQLNRVVVV